LNPTTLKEDTLTPQPLDLIVVRKEYNDRFRSEMLLTYRKAN